MTRLFHFAAAALLLASGVADASPFKAKFPGKQGAHGFYDDSIGNGVASDGIASLPLRSGASRYFVNSSIGSDANSCTTAKTAATPKATLAAASTCITAGAGDQVLVAQGTSYAERMPVMDKGGFSPLYPTVWQSYDPADPLNEAKYGRGFGNRPVIVDSGTRSMAPGSSSVTPKYIVIRGFDLASPDVSGNTWQFINTSKGHADYYLIENNIFRYTNMAFTLSGYEAGGKHIVIRGNAIYAAWNSGSYAQGVYADDARFLTIEDNVFWHINWSPTTTRDASGNDFIRAHSTYLQNTSSNILYRRNLAIDAPTDGGHVLGDARITDNVVIDSPIGLDVSGGTNYSLRRPRGVKTELAYNAIVGSVDTTSSLPNSWGIRTVNTAPGSSAHHNIIAHSANASTVNRIAFLTNTTNEDGGLNNPTYMDWHDNVVYQWATGASPMRSESATNGPVYPTYENNIWDDPSDGNGNRNISEVTFPNPYDTDGLITAAGYAGADAATRKQALIDYATNHPEAHPGRKLLNLMMAGYGINHKVPE